MRALTAPRGLDLESPEGGVDRYVQDADVGYGARYDEVFDAVNPEEVLEGHAVEAVVPGLLDHDVAGLRARSRLGMH